MSTAFEDSDALLEGYLASEGAAALGEPETPRLWAPGREVGEWTVTAFLARGGSAEVYCAKHRRLGTSAALKVLWRTEAGPRERFARETAFLMDNRSPSFPAFYGTGEEEGRPWLAMELLDECPLPQTDASVARYLSDVARAVAALHARGWLHRDLKPRNILRRADGHAVLADFGLLKEIGGPETTAERVSPSVVDGREAGVGTPGWSAPEQFAGGGATPASDVYALGMLAEECFGGKPPRAWEKIIRRATGALPRQRYSGAEALLRAIAHRHRGRNCGLAVLSLLAAAGLAAALWAGRDAIPSAADRTRTTAVRKAGKGEKKDVVAGIIADLVPMRDPFDEDKAEWLIARHEVTQEQWNALMEENPSRFKGPDLPVDNVTLVECLEFIARLNRTPAVQAAGLSFRLPTRTEWWRSAVDDPHPFQDISFLPCANQEEWFRDWYDKGWFLGNSGGTTHPVGQKTPSKAGVHDMWGNVAEPVGPPLLADGPDDRWLRVTDADGTIRYVFRSFSCLGGSIRRDSPVGNQVWFVGGPCDALPEDAKAFFEGLVVPDKVCEPLPLDDPRRDTDQGETVGLRLVADRVAPTTP